jgi:ribulose-phosphate 3-epimerase
MHNNSIEIIPAIMPENWTDLEDKAARFSSYVENIQLDIMDGRFVKEKTWPYKNDEGELQSVIAEEFGLPEWEKVNYEIDLMVSHPEEDALEWIKAGATRVILHIESSNMILETIKKIREEYGTRETMALAPEVGVAIDVATSLGDLDKYIPYVDFVQHMGIAHIGYQGEPFAKEAVARVKTLKAKYPDLIISIDGAVNDESAPLLIEAGATRLVSGSYLLKSGNVKEAIRVLQNFN